MAAGAAKQPSGNHVSPNPSSKGEQQEAGALLEGIVKGDLSNRTTLKELLKTLDFGAARARRRPWGP